MDMFMLDNLYDHNIGIDNMRKTLLFGWKMMQRNFTLFWNILKWQ